MRMIDRKELVWGLFVLGIGLTMRAIFITVFPTRAMIDAYELIDFSRRFADGSIFSHSPKSLWLWQHWNPGLPMYLAPFIKLFGTASDFALASTARWTIAMTCGTIGLIPYAVLHGTITLRLRIIISILLGIWPGQVLFSGVILQDNLVILPTVALASLSVRASLLSRRYPVWSATLFVLSGAIRQETLLTNIPTFLLSSGLLPVGKFLFRKISSLRSELQEDLKKREIIPIIGYAAGILVAGLLTVASLRWLGTGRFAFTSEHGGVAVLGAYAPGAGLTGYVDPLPFAATLRPDYADGVDGRDHLRRDAFRLTFQEALHRHFFHTVRIIGTIAYHLKHADVGGIWWAFGNLPHTSKSNVKAEQPIPWSVMDADKILPGSRHPAAKRFSALANPVIKTYQFVLHVMFVSFFLIALLNRWRSLIATGLVVFMKMLFHGATVMQPRFLLVNTGLELLVVVLGVYLVGQGKTNWKVIIPCLGLGLVSIWVLFLSIPHIENYISTHDNVQLNYHFSLLVYRTIPSTAGSWTAGKLRCEVDQGTLSWLDEGKATLRLRENNPFPGDRAVAQCILEPNDFGEYKVVVRDSYPHGGNPDRVVLQVSVDEKILLRHDVGDKPFMGDMSVSLGRLSPGENRNVLVELLAIRPDPGAYWGSATAVTIKATMMPDGSNPLEKSSRHVTKIP